MANNDFARGFWPIRHLTGGEIRTNTYTLTTGQTVFKGDVVKAVDTGTVEESDADDSVIAVGIAADYVNDSTSDGGKTVEVYDDPDIVFGIQGYTGVTTAATMVFNSANHVAGTGSSSSYLSGHELDTPSAQTAQFKVIGLVQRPDNAWGEHADLEVIFDEHLYKGTSTGI